MVTKGQIVEQAIAVLNYVIENGRVTGDSPQERLESAINEVTFELDIPEWQDIIIETVKAHYKD